METFNYDSGLMMSAKDYIKQKGIEGNAIYFENMAQEEINEFLGDKVVKLIDEGIVEICDNIHFVVIDGESCIIHRGND